MSQDIVETNRTVGQRSVTLTAGCGQEVRQKARPEAPSPRVTVGTPWAAPRGASSEDSPCAGAETGCTKTT